MPIFASKSSFKSTLLVALAAGLLNLASSAASADTITSPTVTPATLSPTPDHPILLADEIIRRLRRLGLNFTKNRIAHPYDPIDELC